MWLFSSIVDIVDVVSDIPSAVVKTGAKAGANIIDDLLGTK